MKTEARHFDFTFKGIATSSNKFRIAVFITTVLTGLSCSATVGVNGLTGFYTQVAVGDPDFGGGSNVGGDILSTGLVQSQLGPNGLPVLSASGITRLGTSSDMNPTTHELLWWSPGADPYVSHDAVPVAVDNLPLSYGYPNPWYPTGQSSDSSFFRTVQWQGTFSMAAAGSIALSLAVDDDAWVFIDGTLVAEDHYGYTSNTSTPMTAGTHSITMFFDDRIPVYDAMNFSSSVPISPVPEPSIASLLIGGGVLLAARRIKLRS